MKYRSDVRTQVRAFLDEVTASNWTDTELNRLINVYYHKVRSAVVTVYEDYYLTTDLFNTTANQEEFGSGDGVATDIFKIRRIEVNYNPSSSNSSPIRLLPIDNIDKIRRDLLYTNTGIGFHSLSNGYYYKYGYGSDIKIGIIPKPSVTYTGAGKIWYVQLGTDLSDDTTAINIPNPDQNWMLIVYGTTADALRFGQVESDEGDRFEAKYDKGIVLMQEELEDYVAEETKTVTDVSGDLFGLNDA